MSLPDCDIVLAGRYRLEGRIATGGMGEVWRAADTVLERPVAVKLLRSGYSGDPETLARFRAEARHAAAVSHPGIAHVYDYGEGGPDDSPFLVMELVDGPALTELVAGGPLDAVQTLDVVAQAAAALAAAHAAGLVHRDIKPGNLLVGRGGIVKITDFGIAYAAGSAPLTRTGALIGTPAYLAPERIAGAPATPACDLYSLGIVAYECLAGAPPFTGSPMQIALAHQRRGVPPLPASVPRPVARFVADLSARDPMARPASAADVTVRARYLQSDLAGPARTDRWLALPARPLAAAAAGLAAAPDRAATAHAADPAAFPAADPATSAVRDLADANKPALAEAPATMPDTAAAGPWQTDPGQDTQQPPESGNPQTRMMLRPPFVLRPPAGSRRSRLLRHPLLLAAAVVAVIAGLAGWLLAGGAADTAAHQAAPTSSPGASAPAPAAARTVEVNRAALIGLQFQAAEQQLRRLGLCVSVTLVPSRGQVPGTVVGVQPGGRLPVGSPVVLAVASPPARHHLRGDDGDGQRGDTGQAGDGGQGDD